ncbi:S66 peptidase family protein [Actinoplanes sp. CA-030573]|uniref:S66 peptidase family protein n=1 Tax=Actinoplanes sp. CA-030573 TaxID=3239898 RepID=UPI003D8DD181
MTVRARPLRAGDLVAIVAPAGGIKAAERVAGAEETLAGWGLKVRVGPHALGRHSFFSGTDDERLADLNEAFRDPEVRGIVCLRGGYGVQRIVDRIDYAAVAADPKLVMGFSDITALHLALWCEVGLATVHGPMASYLERGADGARRALMLDEPVVVRAEPGFRVPGRAEGVLLGGNLTLLAASAGTRHTPDMSGAILLVEEVDEEPYRIDRAIVQLGRAGWLDGLAGVAIGQFIDCVDPGHATSAGEVLAERFGALGVPVLGSLPIGHGESQTAVGLGVPAVLDVERGTLTVGPAHSGAGRVGVG